MTDPWFEESSPEEAIANERREVGCVFCGVDREMGEDRCGFCGVDGEGGGIKAPSLSALEPPTISQSVTQDIDQGEILTGRGLPQIVPSSAAPI